MPARTGPAIVSSNHSPSNRSSTGVPMSWVPESEAATSRESVMVPSPLEVARSSPRRRSPDALVSVNAPSVTLPIAGRSYWRSTENRSVPVSSSRAPW